MEIIFRYLRVFKKGTLSLTRGRVCNLLLPVLLGLASAVTLGSKSHRTRDHMLLSHLSLGSLSVASYYSYGHGGGIISCLHAEVRYFSVSDFKQSTHTHRTVRLSLKGSLTLLHNLSIYSAENTIFKSSYMSICECAVVIILEGDSLQCYYPITAVTAGFKIQEVGKT
jgi:hypothetical protein